MTDADPSIAETVGEQSSGSNFDGSLAALARKREFLAAFAAAQGAFQPIVKNRTAKIKGESERGTPFEYVIHYADLQEIQAKTRPALTANSLSSRALFRPENEQGGWLRVILAHSGGHEEWSECFIAYGKDPKKFAAAQSYMRRYFVQAMLDVAADDDLDQDGQGLDNDDGWQPPAPPPPTQRRSRAHNGNDATPAPPAPAAPPGSVTQAQLTLLRGKLSSLGREEAEFVKGLGVARAEDLTEDQYRSAMAALRKGA